MSITVEDISTTKKRLKIEIPHEVIEKEYGLTLAKIHQKAKMAGFRPGKAPIAMVEKKFSNDIKSDLVDRLVPDYYTKALKDNNFVPLAFPKIEGSLEINKNEPLLFSLTVEVRPEINNLNYEGLKVEGSELKVEEKEIDETLKGLQEERALFEVVDREIKDDDLLILDYVKFDQTGEKELASAKDQIMNLGRNLTPPGILEAILGRKKGDEVEVTLPEVADNEIKDDPEGGNKLRITIKEVKEKKLPDIDDEFAKDFGQESLDMLRDKIRDGLLQAKKGNSAKIQKAKLLDMLVESHDFDTPESLLEREIEHLVMNEQYSENQAKGSTHEAGQEAGAGTITEAERIERLRPTAIKNVKATLLLTMIAEKENVKVSEDEIRTRISLLANQLQSTPDAVMNLFMTRDGSLDNLKHSIRDEKTLDVILSKAEIVRIS